MSTSTGEIVNITRRSILSQTEATMELDVTPAQMDRFDHRIETGEMVQDIFPDLSAGEREFILNGITPTEWDTAFGMESE